MSHQTEQEYKLTANNEAVLAKIRGSRLVQQFIVAHSVVPSRQFSGRYYDTSDLTLHGLRWSLRARQEGTVWRAALKTGSKIQAGLLQCEEFQADIKGTFATASVLPEGDLKQKLQGVIGFKEPLIERVRVEMQRHQCELLIGSVRVEMVTDVGTISANGKKVALCEVELERRNGPLEDIQGFVDQLSDQFALRPSTQSKHQLGLSLY